eukprot:TRINITY_DN13260_c0_g1_i1.p1 TRINITY_DN13260_c0_g1~~TRINITY_DN13260_c0_g1_i1.p1  ORF type:complete len:301 (-),score=71.78 TRINITY_DN13260_c0_g1_i1:73-843(-)
MKLTSILPLCLSVLLLVIIAPSCHASTPTVSPDWKANISIQVQNQTIDVTEYMDYSGNRSFTAISTTFYDFYELVICGSNVSQTQYNNFTGCMPMCMYNHNCSQFESDEVRVRMQKRDEIYSRSPVDGSKVATIRGMGRHLNSAMQSRPVARRGGPDEGCACDIQDVFSALPYSSKDGSCSYNGQGGTVYRFSLEGVLDISYCISDSTSYPLIVTLTMDDEEAVAYFNSFVPGRPPKSIYEIPADCEGQCAAPSSY